MMRTCLYCGRSVSKHAGDDDFPAARLAFDPLRQRVWTVCWACRGWNLWYPDERGTALDWLERAARRARLLWQTDNVALLELGGRELIRIGKSDLKEEAWWRYGRALRRRHAGYKSRLSMVGVASYAAISYMGTGLGLTGITGDFRNEEDVYAGVMRWRQFGETAWSGRAACPYCNSVLLKLYFFKTRSLLLLPGESDDLTAGLPCSRCDPWTYEKVHRFEGGAGEDVLRRVLAYQNISGASFADLGAAVRTIKAAGSAERLVQALAADRASLASLDRTRALALEISLNHEVERRMLAREALGLDTAWRHAEELASIMDNELHG